MHLVINPKLVAWIKQWLREVAVLEPKSLRDEVRAAALKGIADQDAVAGDSSVDGGSFNPFTIHYRPSTPPRWIKQWLGEVAVLEPKSLRDEVRAAALKGIADQDAVTGTTRGLLCSTLCTSLVGHREDRIRQPPAERLVVLELLEELGVVFE